MKCFRIEQTLQNEYLKAILNTRISSVVVSVSHQIIIYKFSAISSKSAAPSSLPLPSGGLLDQIPSPVPSPPPSIASEPMPSATTRHQAYLSPTTFRMRRRRLLRARTRRIRKNFERIMCQFASIENRRLQLEEDRERNLHQRELERLRLESRRLEVVEKQNVILNRFTGTVEKLMEILPQLRS